MAAISAGASGMRTSDATFAGQAGPRESSFFCESSRAKDRHE
jgi:hypothetical protein